MQNIKDKIILITGAGGGTGQNLALDLACRGAIIAAVDINPLGLDETLSRIRAAGGRVKDYLFDTAKRLPVVALVDEVLDDWGRIDVLINAAEVHPLDPLLTMDEWDFHRTLDVNLAGPFFLMQRVAQAMIMQDSDAGTTGGGLIVNGCGSAGMGRHTGLPQRSDENLGKGRPACLPQPSALPPPAGEGAAYTASKAGLTALTQVAAQELQAYHIQVIGIDDFRLLIDNLENE